MLKIGIIGNYDSAVELCGMITRQEICTFSGSYDPDPNSEKPFSGSPDKPVYVSYQAFLSNCDAVIAERSKGLDSGHIVEALRNSKHVLLEKPLDWPHDELEYLFKLTEEANTLLKLRESFLFHPVIKAARSIVHNPAFIDYQIDIAADTPAGRLPGLITGSLFQCLDAMLHLNPARITRSNTVFSQDLFGFPGIIHGRLEFDNGCIANITCNGYAEQEKSICYIYQENRQAILNFVSNRLLVKDKFPDKEKPRSSSIPIPDTDPVAEELQYFIELIINKSYHLVPFHNSFHSYMLGRKMLQNLPIHSATVKSAQMY